MKFKLFLIRKIKALFLKYKLHVFFKPFLNIFSNLIYLSKLSEWRNIVPQPTFNDFYNGNVHYDDRYLLYSHVLNKEHVDQEIDFLEFGVAEGSSFLWWLEHNNHTSSRFTGFDTFTGLPEDWGIFKKGEMTTTGHYPKTNDTRCEFIAGLFQNTLPKFLEKFSGGRRLVVHMDADLYSSSLYVLTSLAPFLKKGDIIFFDEFGVPTHEFRAFSDFIDSYYFQYEVLGAVNNYLQVAVKITGLAIQ